MAKARTGFRTQVVYRHKQPHFLHYATQKFSFWIATFSLFAFVMGNMVGQHGWYAFWKSVMGKTDDSLITFTGTVTPVDKVPDYERWAQYGGTPEEHTYREVPQDLLMPLPRYDAAEQRAAVEEHPFGYVYSVGNLGDYKGGQDGHGSHVGIDIRVPLGTPVRSVANGVVVTVRQLSGGYGHYIVIRHPNVPDSSDPLKRKSTTLYSIYGHLDTLLVSEGQVVDKGQQIATSGQTGFASGPHLHFQIDKDSAPYHPYWPFTSEEAAASKMDFTAAINAGLHQERGALYTMSPMLFVQSNINTTSTTIAKNAVGSTDELAQKQLTLEERVALRKNSRMSRVVVSSSSVSTVAIVTPVTTVAEAPQPIDAAPVTPVVETPAPPPYTPAPPLVIVQDTQNPIDHLEINHDGFFHRGWEKVTITAVDRDGNIVRAPSFPGKIYLRTGFGTAEFRPQELGVADFKSGTATINVLPREAKHSLIIETKGAFDSASTPMLLDK